MSILERWFGIITQGAIMDAARAAGYTSEEGEKFWNIAVANNCKPLILANLRREAAEKTKR